LSPARLIAINALIRIAAAGSGQLFAFLVAERMASHVGAGALFVGAIGAAFFGTELIGAPLAGRIADRSSQRRVLRWGPLFGVASALVAASVVLGAFPLGFLGLLLFLARLNEGASAACAIPTTLALLSRATDGSARRRTRVMGAFEATSLASMIAGYVLLGFAWDRWGAGAFLLLPPVYAAAWLLVGSPGPDRQGCESMGIARHPDAVPSQPSVFDVLTTLAQDRSNRAFGMAWLAINAVVGVWLQQTPFLLTLPDRSHTQALVGGYTGQQVGLVFAVWGLTFMLGIGLWSLLAPEWPRRRTMAVALGGMFGVVASLAALNQGGPAWLGWVAAAFVLVEAGFTPAAFAHLAELTVPMEESRATALGLYSVLLGGGQLMGNILGGGFAARWQMNGVLSLTALLAGVSLVAILRMNSDRRVSFGE